MLVADDQGSPVEDEWYPPFGSPPGYGTELFAERGYTGQRFDIVPELYYYGARWYDPHLGQFTQPDALVPDPLRPIAWNRYAYAYAYNSPLVYADPSGYFPLPPWDVTLDIVFFFGSLGEFIAAPGLGTGFDLFLDAIDLLPGVTGLGWGDEAVGLVAHGDEIVYVSLHGDEAARILDRSYYMGEMTIDEWQYFRRLSYEDECTSGRPAAGPCALHHRGHQPGDRRPAHHRRERGRTGRPSEV